MRIFLLSWVSVASAFSLASGGCGGCDDRSGRLPDAPLLPDAAVDAAIDAAARPVTLTVTRNRAPVAGVRVYFQNADNSLVKSVDTDANGKASAIMDAGGFVTAIDPFPPLPDPGARARSQATPRPRAQASGQASAIIIGDNDLRTFAGVKPGDDLVLALNDRLQLALTLTIPPDPLANDYDIATSCGRGFISTGGGSGSAADLPSGGLSLSDCGALVDFLVIARDAETDRPRSALLRRDVPVSDGGDVDLSTMGSYQALADVEFTFRNVPNSNALGFIHTLIGPRGPFGISFEGSAGLASGSGSATIAEPAGAGTIGVVHSSVVLGGSRQHIVDWGASSPAYLLDMTGQLLPDIDVPSYDQQAKKLTWTESGAGATPDLTIATINVSAGSETQRFWRWTVAAPYRRGELLFPTLPTDVASWTPGPDDSVNSEDQMNVRVVAGGYDAVRSRALNVRDAFFNDGSFVGLVAGPTGRAVIVVPERGEVRVRRR
jgi:hypothetical protein